MSTCQNLYRRLIIRPETFLDVFNTTIVYSVSGSIEGMKPVFNGAVNFTELIEYINSYPEIRLTQIDGRLTRVVWQSL